MPLLWDGVLLLQLRVVVDNEISFSSNLNGLVVEERGVMRYFIALPMLVYLCNFCYAEEVYEKYGDDIFAWTVTDWKGAYKVQKVHSAFTPNYILGRKEGEFLVLAHRYLICPYCNFTYGIGFIGPFSRVKCEKCGREYDEEIALYKWYKKVEREGLVK